MQLHTNLVPCAVRRVVQCVPLPVAFCLLLCILVRLCVPLQSLVVWAIAEGRGAAAEVDAFIMKGEPVVYPSESGALAGATYTNGHATNGHATNGHATNGHASNGHANGKATNGKATNGHAKATNGKAYPAGVAEAREQAAEVGTFGLV